MIASKETWKDVQKYYHNTYVKFASEGERLWQITEVSSKGLVAVGSNGEEIFLDFNYPTEIDFVLPRKAVYQYGERAVMLARLPARMWKKGISTENTVLTGCNAVGNWTKMSFDISSLEGFVNKPGYFEYSDAKNMFEAGALSSAALSRRFSVTAKGRIYLDNLLVGRVMKTGIVAKQIFIPEMKPLFPGVKFKEVS